MPYSNEDFILTGDDVTGDILRSPTTVYIGDGSVEGFTFVKVCTKKSLELRHSGSTFFSTRMVMFSYQAQNSGIMIKNYALNILRMQDKLRQHVISLIMLHAL